MSQPLSFDQVSPPPAPTRHEFDALLARQNQIAVRCIAMENVVRSLGAWLTAALPPASAERFLDSLATLGDVPVDAAMPAHEAERLKNLVAREQRHIVDLIRQQNGPRPASRPEPGPPEGS
jgi:hypothetical protein